ncbi:hypothetical protein [Pseudomonas oryzihabitans]|uniref:hypothetical protein n=1 Tax=Pseudomonas oryzihabitans TaxID=47885 RepID=UPI002859C049|nr:hypothetical protein [Pseudomonas psychrotolerans]MDR6680216.1 succinate dehydrogenase/fumarate reductase flavoprotein subunit [Pseudomonas psychrotolerans]
MRSGLALYQALRSIDVAEDKATAVVDALEIEMQTQLATKADLADIKADIKSDLADIKADFAKLQATTKAEFAQNELKLTIRMGVMISTAVGIMLTAMKFMH